MAFIKTADAKFLGTIDNINDWQNKVRDHMKVASDLQIPKNINLNDYLLSHCTIISSVDVEKDVDYYITPESEAGVNSNGDSWERRLLLNSYKTFIGGYNFLEHKQIKELNKGFIVDAVARDIGKFIYIDILVATHKKHNDLVAKIKNKQYHALSMGTKIAFTICSQCGNKANDETELCSHQRYMKGTHFIDEKGQKRIVAELCGHWSQPDSNVFFEASWVQNPAFKGAERRNFLNKDIDEKQAKIAYQIMSNRTDTLIREHLNAKQASENNQKKDKDKEKEIKPQDMDTNDNIIKFKAFLNILSGLNVNSQKLKLACILYDIDLFNIKNSAQLINKIEKEIGKQLTSKQRRFILSKVNFIKNFFNN